MPAHSDAFEPAQRLESDGGLVNGDWLFLTFNTESYGKYQAKAAV